MNVQSVGRTGKRPIKDLLARAMEHHQKGELPQAEVRSGRAGGRAPRHGRRLLESVMECFQKWSEVAVFLRDQALGYIDAIQL